VPEVELLVPVERVEGLVRDVAAADEELGERAARRPDRAEVDVLARPCARRQIGAQHADGDSAEEPQDDTLLRRRVDEHPCLVEEVRAGRRLAHSDTVTRVRVSAWP